jgi:hypothetical protein
MIMILFRQGERRVFVGYKKKAIAIDTHVPSVEPYHEIE